MSEPEPHPTKEQPMSKMKPNEAIDQLRRLFRAPGATCEDIVAIVSTLRDDAETWSAELREQRQQERPRFEAEIQAAAKGKRGSRKALAEALSLAAMTVPGGAYDAADLLIVARCGSTGLPVPAGVEYRKHKAGGT